MNNDPSMNESNIPQNQPEPGAQAFIRPPYQGQQTPVGQSSVRLPYPGQPMPNGQSPTPPYQGQPMPNGQSPTPPCPGQPMPNGQSPTPPCPGQPMPNGQSPTPPYPGQQMPFNPYQPQYGYIPQYAPYQPKPKRKYDAFQKVFAWVFFVFSYLFVRLFFTDSLGLGAALFVVGIFAATSAFIIKLRRDGALRQYNKINWGFAVIPVLLSAGFVISSNATVRGLLLFLSALSYLYWIFTVTGTSVQTRFAEYFPAECAKSVFVTPFRSFTELFNGMFSSKKTGGKAGRIIGWIFLGLAVAVIPTIVICGFLSYDAVFSEIMRKLFDWDIDEIVLRIFSLVLAIPVGMYIFGHVISCVDDKTKPERQREKYEAGKRNIRFSPLAMTVSAVIPILVIYVIFFISQWEMYMSAFTNILPERYVSFSEYANEGFFNLCAVSAINALILLAINLFTRHRKDGKPSVTQRVLSAVVCVFTLILIATAMSKMVLYVNSYGFTPKRFAASWFMLLLAAAFIAVIVKQLVSRLNCTAVLLAVFIAFFSTVTVYNPSAFIANYNVDAYLDGRINDIDISLMYELGDAAPPAVLKLLGENASQRTPDAETIAEAQNYIKYYERMTGSRKQSFFSFNFETQKAYDDVQKSGLKYND